MIKISNEIFIDVGETKYTVRFKDYAIGAFYTYTAAESFALERAELYRRALAKAESN